MSLRDYLGLCGDTHKRHLIGAGGMGPATGAGAFASPIPWRKAGLRYNNNDIYFDVVEELKAVVNK